MLSVQNLFVEKSGRALFAPLTFSFGRRHYGLVGSSGSGKTTLARVLSGFEEPTGGEVLRRCRVHLFAQHAPRPEGSVDDFLADLWTTPAPSLPLWRVWLPQLDPGAPVRRLSGGEWTRLRLLRLLGGEGDFVILDEPTNHLDRDGRAAVAEFVDQHAGGLIVVSHDRNLLRHIDEIVELTPAGLQRFGGAFDFYWAERAAQRRRQEEAVEHADRKKKHAAREAKERLAAQDKRMRAGQRRADKGGLPAIIAGGLRRRAEVTRGKVEVLADAKVDRAEREWFQAVRTRQTDPFLRLDFESSAPPAGAVFFAARELRFRFPGAGRPLWERPLDFVMSGRERWRLGGGNGAGKSTLLRLLCGEAIGAIDGELRRTERPFVHLDQEQSLLALDRSLLESLGTRTRFTPVELRNELAFYGFTGVKVHQQAGTFSGGERLRAALAVMFLGAQLPQAILLDEPTNNLDFQSQELLVAALARFDGLLVVASHDEAFTSALNVTATLELRAAPPLGS